VGVDDRFSIWHTAIANFDSVFVKLVVFWEIFFDKIEKVFADLG